MRAGVAQQRDHDGVGSGGGRGLDMFQKLDPAIGIEHRQLALESREGPIRAIVKQLDRKPGALRLVRSARQQALQTLERIRTIDLREIRSRAIRKRGRRAQGDAQLGSASESASAVTASGSASCASRCTAA